MKVLHFTDGLLAGGKERQLIELLKGLSKYQHIICELALMSESIYYTSVEELNIRITHLIRKTKKDPTIFFKLYSLCARLGPDIIHTWDSMSSVYAMPVAKILRIKLVNGMIRDAPLKLKPFHKAWNRSKLTFPFSDAIVSNSLAGIKSYGAPSPTSICIHNGYDLSRIDNVQSKHTVRDRFRVDTDNVVGMVASFSNKKDYETFIASAKLVLKKRDDVTFLAIGDGENLENYRQMVTSEYEEKIRFLGKQKDVESIIGIFNIGVLSTDTRFHGEGFSNSITEYMISGIPVIATECGGTGELILHGTTGFLIGPRDANAMSCKINKLLEDKELARIMGNAGKERIKKYFNLENMTNSYIKLYQKILGRKHLS